MKRVTDFQKLSKLKAKLEAELKSSRRHHDGWAFVKRLHNIRDEFRRRKKFNFREYLRDEIYGGAELSFNGYTAKLKRGYITFICGNGRLTMKFPKSAQQAKELWFSKELDEFERTYVVVAEEYSWKEAFELPF